MADRIFREPKRQAAQKEKREREEAEQSKQLENRWSPWLEKAMQRYGVEFEDVLKELIRHIGCKNLVCLIFKAINP